MKTKDEILQDFGCGVIPYDENVTMYYPAILDAMDEYASQFKPRWIPVSERLPEDADEVLVTDGKEVIQAYLHDGYWHGSSVVTDNMSGVHIEDRRICKQGGGFDYITHWTPLLEPPKTENA